MFLTRRVNYSYEQLHQIELTDKVKSDLLALMAAYDDENDFSFDDMTNADWDYVWGLLSELHLESGEVIAVDDDFWYTRDEEVSEYGIEEDPVIGQSCWL